jgi:hypothetical protein
MSTDRPLVALEKVRAWYRAGVPPARFEKEAPVLPSHAT